LDQLGGFFDGSSPVNLQARFVDKFFSFLCVGSLKPYDDGHRHVTQVFICLDYSLCYTVTSHNTPENIYQNSFYLWIFKNNFKTGLNCLGISGTSGQTCNNDGDCAGAFDSAWNPSCSNSGYCGASFCAGACPNPSAGDGGCPAGSCGYQITDLGCACVPNPVEKKCSDPVNNVGCNTGYMCVPAGGSGLSCETEGTCDFEQTCGTSVCECKAGHLCAGSGGSYSCMKLCDTEGDGSDCPAQYICGGITCVDKWGVCVKVPPCTITDGASACADAGDVCIPLHNCGSYGCFSSGGKNAGESCTNVNDCAAGLVCEGGQGQATCKPVCDPANPNCSSGTCQAPAGVCDPAPTTWGVCK